MRSPGKRRPSLRQDVAVPGSSAYGYPNFESFRAWLSDDTDSPATSFFHSEGRCIMVTGEVVAENWADLTDRTLVNGIDGTLAGEEVNGYPI